MVEELGSGRSSFQLACESAYLRDCHPSLSEGRKQDSEVLVVSVCEVE